MPYWFVANQLVILWKIKYMSSIKIALVDDNPTLLRNLSQNLSVFEEISIVFTAFNGADAVSKIRNNTVDVVLMDIEMPVLDGIESTRQIKAEFPNQKIMMLTVLDREDKIFEAVKAGATGYLLKDERPSRILACIEEMLEGGAPMSPIVAMKTLEILKKQQINETKIEAVKSTDSFNLSKREVEILEKIANGFNYNQIADQLFISAKTARKHIENIYSKLQVHSKLEMVHLAQKNRWI